MTYSYILSERYSGSTLLSFLLNTHPAIGTIGERRKFYNKFLQQQVQGTSRCSCGASFTSCSFWQEVHDRFITAYGDDIRALNFTEYEFAKSKGFNGMIQRSLTYLIAQKVPFSWHPYAATLRRHNVANRHLMEAILQAAGASVFLDSSKSLLQAILTSHMRAIDLKFIWLVRDPRAQVGSAIKYNDWSVTEAVKRWIGGFERVKKWLAQNEGSYVLIKYHALCADPTNVLRQIAAQLNLNPLLFDLDFRSHTQHIMGNFNMRMGDDRKILERQEWRQQLSRDQVKTIEEMTEAYRSFYSPQIAVRT